MIDAEVDKLQPLSKKARYLEGEVKVNTTNLFQKLRMERKGRLI